MVSRNLLSDSTSAVHLALWDIRGDSPRELGLQQGGNVGMW